MKNQAEETLKLFDFFDILDASKTHVQLNKMKAETTDRLNKLKTKHTTTRNDSKILNEDFLNIGDDVLNNGDDDDCIIIDDDLVQDGSDNDCIIIENDDENHPTAFHVKSLKQVLDSTADDCSFVISFHITKQEEEVSIYLFYVAGLEVTIEKCDRHVSFGLNFRRYLILFVFQQASWVQLCHSAQRSL